LLNINIFVVPTATVAAGLCTVGHVAVDHVDQLVDEEVTASGRWTILHFNHSVPEATTVSR